MRSLLYQHPSSPRPFPPVDVVGVIGVVLLSALKLSDLQFAKRLVICYRTHAYRPHTPISSSLIVYPPAKMWRSSDYLPASRSPLGTGTYVNIDVDADKTVRACPFPARFWPCTLGVYKYNTTYHTKEIASVRGPLSIHA